MGAYSTIGENIGDMLKELCESEIIGKLLTNSKQSALTDSLPISFNGLDLLNDRIWDIPKELDPNTEDGSFIFAYFDDSNLSNSVNVNQYNMIVNVLIITHKNSWQLDYGKKRPLELLDEVDSLVKNTKTASIRGEWQLYSSAKFIKYNKNFNGYLTRWVVTNNSKKCYL